MPPALQLSPRMRQYARPGDLSDRYWRTPQYVFGLALSIGEARALLKSHNYPHTGPASEFEALLNCIARSLPGYEKCKIAELRHFVQQRGLGDEESMTRKELIDALRLADRNPRFGRLLDLPAEVRNTVYELYCSDFSDEALHLPTWPPLARVNKQLRREVLPTFYSECTFGISLTTESYWNGVQEPRRLRMERDTTLFFRSLSAESLAYIQKLEVTFESRGQQPSGNHRLELRAHVPRNGKKATARIVVHEGYQGATVDEFRLPWGGRTVGSDRLGELEDLVVGLARKIQGRVAGRNHLLLDDVYDMRRTVESFCIQASQ